MARIICDRQATAARGDDPAGYVWQQPGDVVDVDPEHAVYLLRIPWFSEVQPPPAGEPEDGKPAGRRGRRTPIPHETDSLGGKLEMTTEDPIYRG